MTDEHVLEVEAVSKSFGDLEVLSDVSFSVSEGEVVGLIGPNGSGKTTLLRTIVDDLRPSSGQVSYVGPDAGRPIGYLPQHPTFRPGFTAFETLSFYTSLVEGPDPGRLLERVGLDDAGDRDVAALSGGMRRLLGIAQAMVGDPPCIVLDEPASGLDPIMSRTIYDTAAEMTERGTAVLLSSHDLPLVESVADVVVVLARGTVAASASPSALRARFDADSLHGVLESVVEETGQVAVVGGGR